MSEEHRDAQLAARVLEMRTPLSRIELAASQLLRTAPSPALRALVGSIRDAVGELDGQVERTLLALSPAPETQGRDCREIPGEVVDRLAAVLGARGIDCRARRAPPEAWTGDPERVRRGAVALLRSGARWAGEGGSVELGFDTDEAGPALLLMAERGAKTWVAARPDDPGFEADAAEAAFADAHDLALAQGAELRLMGAGDGGLRARLCFEPGAAA